MIRYLAVLLIALVPFYALAQVDVEVDVQSGASVQFTNGVDYLPDGSRVVVGTTFGNISFGAITLSPTASSYNVFVARYDAAGNPLWADLGQGLNTDFGQDVVVTPFGDIYVCGAFNQSITFGSTTLTSQSINFFQEQGYIVKYDSSGNVQWAEGITGLGNAYVVHHSGGPTGIYTWREHQCMLGFCHYLECSERL